jgi:hypothetical protein
MDNEDWFANALNDPSQQTKMPQHEGVQLYPLTGHSTMALSATGVLLKIEFLSHDGAKLLPLGLTRAQCTELADSLKRIATLPHKPSDPRN